VLDGGSEDVAGFAPDVAGEVFESGVVGLGAAACEDDFFRRFRVNEVGDLFTSAVNGLAGFFAIAVAGGGVVVVVTKPRQHGIQDFGVDGGGGVVV